MNDLEQTAKTLLDHNVQKRNAAERAEQSLTIAYNGGLFKVTVEFICAIHFCEIQPLILKDEYGNPVKIVDKQDFTDKMVAKYKEVMNDWYNEYEELKRVRKPEQL